MSYKYEENDIRAIRADFKKHHFDISTTNFDLLVRKYNAATMFYKNTDDKSQLLNESLRFYNIYQYDVVDKIRADKKYMLSIEKKICHDLIYMEYIQKSSLFDGAFGNMDAELQKCVKKEQIKQRNLRYFECPKHDLITPGEACFVLYLHPEFEDVIKHMLTNFMLSEPMQTAIDKGNKQSLQKQRNARKSWVVNSDDIIIRQSWQVGRIK